MDVKKIKELISILDNNNLKKLHFKEKDFELFIEKEMPSVEGYQKPKLEVSGVEKEGVFITSPMVGTFYSSSPPDQPPFVKIGDKVEKGTVVCIIEAMKVMNEVKSDVSGTVAEILVENAQPVEYGTKLFKII